MNYLNVKSVALKFNSLSLRERAMIFLAVILAFFVNFLLILLVIRRMLIIFLKGRIDRHHITHLLSFR